jgi:GTPase SAR1 family protein
MREIFSDTSLWDDCKQLKTVILYMNALETLPTELSQYSDEIWLLLILNNEFTQIPRLAYDFKNLNDLIMHGNHLSSLPNSFAISSNLTKLYLGSNDLVYLPDAFDQLPNLTKASFYKNSLKRLPHTFSKLSKLESLDISNNAIMKFPEPLLELKNLTLLNVERNRILRFTPTAGELYQSTLNFFRQLSLFRIKGNPVYQHEMFKDIQKQDILKVLTNGQKFEELSRIKPNKSLRINVLGESGSGKTSVVQAFTREKYVITTTRQRHRKTVGIDRCYFSVKIGGETVLLHIWDHAGDDEYAMMNDLFISNNSIVWLVVNLDRYEATEHDEDETIFHRHIGHWLLQVMLHNLTPVVWIVCTHTDKAPSVSVKTDHIRYWMEKFCEKVQESLVNKHDREEVPTFLKKWYQVIELSNTYSFHGFKKLTEAFNKLPDKYASVTLPTEWETAYDNLQAYAERELLSPQCIPAISTTSTEFEEVLQPLHETAAFLEYLHDTGEIYWLKNENIALLNVDWMISLLQKVYHFKFDEMLETARKKIEFAKVSAEILNHCPSMRKDCGLIVESILDSLWKCTDRKIFEKIIFLFMKFNLTYPVEKEMYGALQTFYFFPHLTKHECPPKDLTSITRTGHITLQFHFKFFFPKFFLQRLALKFWQHKHDTIIYKDGFETKLNDSICLCITHMKMEKPHTEGMIMLAYYDDRVFDGNRTLAYSALWSAIQIVFKHTHAIISSCWNFYGMTDVFVDCPNCVSLSRQPCNFVCLMNTGSVSAELKLRSIKLFCSKCHQESFIEQLVPLPDLNFCHFVRIRDVTDMKDFKNNIPGWEFRKHRTQTTREPPRPFTSAFPRAHSVGNESEMLSYSASSPFEEPVQESVQESVNE